MTKSDVNVTIIQQNKTAKVNTTKNTNTLKVKKFSKF